MLNERTLFTKNIDIILFPYYTNTSQQSLKNFTSRQLHHLYAKFIFVIDTNSHEISAKYSNPKIPHFLFPVWSPILRNLLNLLII